MIFKGLMLIKKIKLREAEEKQTFMVMMLLERQEPHKNLLRQKKDIQKKF